LWSGVIILIANLLYFAWVAMKWHEVDQELRSEAQSEAESSGDSQGPQEGWEAESSEAWLETWRAMSIVHKLAEQAGIVRSEDFTETMERIGGRGYIANLSELTEFARLVGREARADERRKIDAERNAANRADDGEWTRETGQVGVGDVDWDVHGLFAWSGITGVATVSGGQWPAGVGGDAILYASNHASGD
jgi:hypothetical protein